MVDLYAQSAEQRNTTPQIEQARPDQVVNNAGGFVFGISDLARVKRFLLLGSDAGTYYQTPMKLTKENATLITTMADDDQLAEALVGLIVDVSVRGLAQKVQPALFALAIAANGKSTVGRKAAKEAMTQVVRTGSHLLTYSKYVDLLGGWSRAKRGAIINWYDNHTADQLAYQMIKYRQREGWSQRDVLRVVHPIIKRDMVAPEGEELRYNGYETAEDQATAALFDWVTKDKIEDGVPELVLDFQEAQSYATKASKGALLSLLGGADTNLSWEMLPDWALTDRSIWELLLDTNRLPMTALLRNLARLTNLEVIRPFFGAHTHQIVNMLTNQEALIKARVHPISILIAAKTYAKGQMRDGTRYTPSTDILIALDQAFHLAFGAVEPAGKSTLIGLDVSGSMGGAYDPSGILTAREVGAAMALVLAATEPHTEVFGFTAEDGRGWGGGPTKFTPLNISGKERLGDIIRQVTNLPFGRTDCSLPMQEALKNNWDVDTFVVITDNETYAGSEHPYQSLEKYRHSSASRKNAKLIVLSVTASSFSIADPSDPMGQLDICGFGSDVPQLVTAFSKG